MGAVGNYEVVAAPFSQSFSDPFGGTRTVQADAPAGKVVLGASIVIASGGNPTIKDRPASDGAAWLFDLTVGNTATITGTTHLTVAEMGG